MALIGFDEKLVENMLQDKKITKLAVFDEDDDKIREAYEKIYARYGDRITLYEGSVPDLLEEYFENHGPVHGLEILEKYENVVSILD
jgi:hypothetical protein